MAKNLLHWSSSWLRQSGVSLREFGTNRGLIRVAAPCLLAL